MNPYNEIDEITISTKKLFTILYSRKSMFLVFILAGILCAIIATVIMPKKYESSAKLLIDKASSTNLADINPFMIADISKGNTGLSLLTGKNENLGNEIEILKSPLVLEPVILENGIKYERGPKKGKYVDIEHFLKKNIFFECLKGTNIIKISYKSKDPKLSHDVVNSIIQHYSTIYENINSGKAFNDKEFLKKSYFEAKKTFDRKFSELKRIKSFGSQEPKSDILGLLSLYDKRLNANARNIAESNISFKKLETELEQEAEKLKMLKTKYDWTILVENMAKKSSNLLVIKKPNLPETNDYFMPNTKINLIIGIVISILLFLITICWIELTSKKITYSDLPDDVEILDKKNPDFIYIKTRIIAKNLNQIAVLSLADDDKTNTFMQNIKYNLGDSVEVALSKNIAEHINNIAKNTNIIVLSQHEYTERDHYKKLKSSCNDLDRIIIREFYLS